MPEDYMAPAGGDEGSGEAPEQQAQETKAENTALLPSSLFGKQPLEVGQSLTVKVVSVHGDEVEVQAESEQKEEQSEQPPKSSMDEAMSKFDAAAGQK